MKVRKTRYQKREIVDKITLREPYDGGQDSRKSARRGIGMRTRTRSGLLGAVVDRLAPEGTAEGQEAGGHDSSARGG